MEKAETQAVEPRIRTGDSGGRALDGETVDSGSATEILDGQPGARADVMETRAEGWDWGSRRWNRELISGTGMMMMMMMIGA